MNGSFSLKNRDSTRPLQEFANIAKDIHESKSDKTTAASKESPKSERTESGNGEGSAADAETEEKGGEHTKAEGTGSEATLAGEEKGGGAAAEGKSGESDAGSGSAEIKVNKAQRPMMRPNGLLY